MSIQKKLIVGFFVMILISTLTISVVVITLSERIIKKQVSERNLKSIQQISAKIEMISTNMVSLSNMYILNEDINEILDSDVKIDTYQYRLNRHKINSLFNTFIYSFGNIQYYTSIIGFGGQQFHSNVLYQDNIDLDKIEEEKWYKDVLKADGRMIWISDIPETIENTVGEDVAFVAAILVKNFISNSNLGILTLSVKESSFRKLYQNAVDENEEIFVLDNRGFVISAKSVEMIELDVSDFPNRDKILKDELGYYNGNYNGTEGLIIFDTVEGAEWKVVNFIPYEIILKEISQLKFIVIIVIIIMILLSFIISYYVARQLSNPIKQLHNDIIKVRKGNLDVKTPIRSTDEIGEMSSEFNYMVERIQKLMKDLDTEYKIKRKAEIRALQAQINPHFLYNTLATIRGMLALGKKDKVDKAIVSLVKLLKNTLSISDEIIPIEDEVDNIYHYINIHKARQGEGLKFVINIDEKILKYKMIKMIVQPIIENSIFHGLEMKEEGAKIEIIGRIEEGNIIFEVKDNGVGISKSKIEQIMETSKKQVYYNDKNGIGLSNINNRIKLHFGSDYGLDINSKPGETVVRITLPVIK